MGTFFPCCSPRFLKKLPNTKKGALCIPRLLGILDLRRVQDCSGGVGPFSFRLTDRTRPWRKMSPKPFLGGLKVWGPYKPYP